MSRETVPGRTGLVAFELTPTEAHMFVKVYGKELRKVCSDDENTPLCRVCVPLSITRHPVPSGDCGQGCTSAPLPGSAVTYVTHDRYGQLQRSVGEWYMHILHLKLTVRVVRTTLA